MSSNKKPEVGIIMGSDSDYPVMKDAHRTPDEMVSYARTARERGLKVIIAGAGGAAHLPGMTAALTDLPVVGVPVPLKNLDGLDSLLSIVQMPKGVPVATVAVGNSANAAYLAIRIIATFDEDLAKKIGAFTEQQRNIVIEKDSNL